MPDTIEISRAEYEAMQDLERSVRSDIRNLPRTMTWGELRAGYVTLRDAIDAARKPPTIEERALEVCRKLAAVQVMTGAFGARVPVEMIEDACVITRAADREAKT